MNNEEEPDLSIDDVDMEDDTDNSVVGDFPTIIDLVMDGKASEAKDAIFASLYHKVSDRIDSLRPEVRAAVNAEKASEDSTEE